MENSDKKLETCGFTHVMKRLGKLLAQSDVLRRELPKISFLSFIVCVVFYFLASCLDIIKMEIITSPYVTLLGFSLSTFAIFVSEVKDLEVLLKDFKNANNAIADFVTLSIIGLIIPIIGIVPNLITIPGFHVWNFYDNHYWNIYFCSMSIFWIFNSIIHVISIKITNITNNKEE